MAIAFVARSATLSAWGSDVGLGKHLFKVGVTDQPLAEVLAAGWAGATDWTAVKKQPVAEADEAAMIERASTKAKMVDPFYYPRLKGAVGIFRLQPTQVENDLIVARAMAGEESLAPAKLKTGDFAAYLLRAALG